MKRSSIEELIGHSSLGTPSAAKVRARTPSTIAEAIVEKSKHARVVSRAPRHISADRKDKTKKR